MKNKRSLLGRNGTIISLLFLSQPSGPFQLKFSNDYFLFCLAAKRGPRSPGHQNLFFRSAGHSQLLAAGGSPAAIKNYYL